MGFWDQVEDGLTDIASGAGGFVTDSFKAGREFGDFNFGEGLGIVVNSFQEDLLGEALMGAIGPEGVGSALLGKVPEEIRNPIGQVVSPVLGYLDWSIQELVDRPLGTFSTVVNATNPFNGKHSIVDLSTWSRAWDINDKRTFGQSFAAALYSIDPFDSEEYNSIQDDPLFDLISGTADFVQELIDPTLLVAGGALKLARGKAVISTAADGTRTVGRSFGTTGGNSRIARYLAPRQGTLEPSHVVGRGVGLRPATIAGSQRKFVTKNDTQQAKLREIKRNVASQRARNVGDSPFMREVLGDAVDAAAKAKALERSEFLDKKAEADEFNYNLGGEEPSGVLNANERFGVIRTALGTAGRNLPDESIRLIANGETTAQRINTFKILAGDFSVLEEANAGASLITAELKAMQNKPVPNRVEQPAGNVGDFSFSAEAQNAIDNFDFALFDAFEHNLILAQRRHLTPDYDSQEIRINSEYWDTLNEMPVDKTIVAFEQMLGKIDGSEASYINALGTNVIPRQIQNLPFGGRLHELARQHRIKSKKDGAAFTEHINPHTAFGSRKKIRMITEKLPFTHIFFTEANALDQFERVLTQASRVEDGVILKNAGINVNEILGEFTALKIENRYSDMGDLYNLTIKRINNSVDRYLEKNEFDFGSLAGVDVNHRTYQQMWEQNSSGWVDEQRRIIALTNPEGEVPTALQPGQTLDDPLLDVASGLRVIRDENANVILQQLAFSPSQIEQSALLPRYDVVGKEMKIWKNKKREAKAKKAVERAEWTNKNLKTTRNIEDVRNKALVPFYERVISYGRSPANQAHQFWRKAVLSTPKWPMRVQLDEQMRIAASIGALSTIANFAGGFEKMRQAQAVHKLSNWDELKKIDNLEKSMAAYARKKKLDIPLDATLNDLYEAVGPKGFNAAINDVTKQLVIDSRAKARLRRNAVAKGALFYTFMGNPVMGAAYGLVSKHSRRRRINDSAQKTAALHYAGALKIEGRKLLNEATSPEDFSVGKSLIDDAVDIESQVTAKNTKRANNAFESAEELLSKAGFPGITIGRSTLRNAFGDDGRFIEQIEASNSANEALSSIYRSANDTAQRELKEFAPDYVVRDYLELEGSSEPFETGFAQMMNRMTSATAQDNPFYGIVWGNAPSAKRVDDLANLLATDPILYNDLLRNSLDLGEARWLSVEDYQTIAKEIIKEYDEVLPPKYFANARANAQAGDINWKQIENDFQPVYAKMGGDISELQNQFDSEDAYLLGLRKKVIENVREEYPNFGKTFTAKSVNSPKDKQAVSWVNEKFDNIFSVLAEIPSDQLARHPFFKTVYERELRRMVEPLQDADGMISLSQKKINEYENFAREQALTETRTLLYDLRETTSAAEVLANVAPFFNAWQEVIGRWAGLISDNPTFVANVGRLYNKQWSAETLGLSEIEDENGNKYVTFRMTGPAYDKEGNEKTIFEVMPESVKNWIIPAPLRDTNDTVRFSKDSLNTMLEGSPGVGPMVTIPLREAIVATPQLEETMRFFFPFGHPQGGMIDRVIIGNLPAWGQAAYNVMMETHRHDAVQTRMYRDLVVAAQASGEFIDWADEEVWRDFQVEAENRTRNWFLFKVGAGLFSPASTTLISAFEPLKQEYRAMQQEHGKLVAEDMFLTQYGEDFHALTSALSRSNDGLPASATTEQFREMHKGLIELMGDSGVGAYVVRAVGSDLETLRYNQTIQNQQFLEPVQPGSDVMRRELYTGRELVETNQARLGWRSYSQIADWVKGKQNEADSAGLSTNLGSAHLQPVSAVKQQLIEQLSKANPAWAAEYKDILSSDNKRNSVNAAFMKVLADPVVSQRDSALKIAEYYRARQWVQSQLEQRKAAGGSANLERANANADLRVVWENIRTDMSLQPTFAATFDRYFTRDMISEATFIEADSWPEGFLNV